MNRDDALVSNQWKSLRAWLTRKIRKNQNFKNIDFDADHYRSAYPDLADMSDKQLFEHWEKFGYKEGRYASLAHAINLEDLMGLSASEQQDIIANSEFFSEEFYEEENADVKRSSLKAANHYAHYGWKEGRLPSGHFDSYWYETRYLARNSLEINPVVFHERVGKKIGYKNRPSFTGLGKKVSLPKQPRRVCLFAGYDRDGVIDKYVVDLVKELSEFSDIYMLMDSDVSENQLSKIKAFTKGVWAYRHGEYDFGSYKRLANTHVGWNEIEKYDELLLVNDSSYLAGSLKPVFDKMSMKETSWWGLQATKGMISTKNKVSNSFKEKVSLEEVKRYLLEGYFSEDIFDFHVGSYFLAFRKNIINDEFFRSLIDNVSYQKGKKSLILKYEIGLTKLLLAKGYDFETFMDDLYPLHPVYTDAVYEMMQDGFPLFKRYFLTENHYRQKDLYEWKNKIIKIYPDADVSAMEKNLLRVADASKLYKNLDVEHKGRPVYSDEEFFELDKVSRIDKSVWVFPVCGYNHNLDDNTRAIYEEVKNDPEIKKVVLFRSKFVELDGVNVDCVPLISREGQDFLLKSFVVFIKHTPWRNTLYPLDSNKHKFINLWHGIPLKRIGVASLDNTNRMAQLIEQHNKCHSVISSSNIDRLAMAASFYPLKYSDVWLTGLPRHDFIVKKETDLPGDMKDELFRIREATKNKKFILYAPTFRNDQEGGYYTFSENEKAALFETLESNDIMLGIREHMADTGKSYTAELNHPMVFNAGSHVFRNVEMLYREASVLITDYSSCFIDYMLTGKPMLSFAYDLDSYINDERGMFYDLDFSFPGPVCKTFESFYSSLKYILEKKTSGKNELYDMKKEIFFKYNDEENSRRVVDRVKQIEVACG